MIKIDMKKILGTTFNAAIYSAFPSVRSIKIPLDQQNGNIGTILIDGEWFDWWRDGDVVTFLEA